MNDLTTFKVQMFFSARELAELAAQFNSTELPHTERGVQLHATKMGWDKGGAAFARKRSGRGGGMEYHRSLMPRALHYAMEGARLAESARKELSLARSEGDQKIVAFQQSRMSSAVRTVMEARAEILTSIEGMAIANGRKRSWGIARFIEAQKAYHDRVAIEARRDAGQALGDAEAISLTKPLLLTAASGFQLDPERLQLANDRRKSSKVGRSTIYEWFKRRDEHGVVGLAPSATKEAEPVPAGFAEFLRHYASPTKPSIEDAYRKYADEAEASSGTQPMTLTLDQVRYIMKSKMNDIEKSVGREGLLTLRSRMPYITRTTEDMWPTTIYTADGKTFDAEIADPVTWRPIRPEITTVMDVVTRKVVGISLARSENQKSVAEALRRSCVSHGICAIFYVDRGPGYRNEAMDADVSGLMGRLGVTKMHAAPYGSQAKGLIERPNATIWDTLAKRLPTYIGRDMDKEAGDKIHKITRREIKEFGQSAHLPTWDAFVKLCDAMVEEYNAKPHRGLPRYRDEATGKWRHLSPNEAWAAHVEGGFAPIEVAEHEIDDLFRPYEIRTCRRAEVKWNNNSYFDHALTPYHQEKVMVGYDYHQGDRVWVREFDVATGQPGKLICVAQFMANAERYVPKSFEDAAIETRAKGRMKRLEAKIDAVQAELQQPQLYDMRAAHVPAAEVFDAAPQAEVIEVLNVTPITASPAPSGRRFASDEALAAWALDHPDELSPNQIRVLMQCVKDATARKVLEMSGVDTEALRHLLRTVA